MRTTKAMLEQQVRLANKREQNLRRNLWVYALLIGAGNFAFGFAVASLL